MCFTLIYFKVHVHVSCFLLLRDDQSNQEQYIQLQRDTKHISAYNVDVNSPLPIAAVSFCPIASLLVLI